MSEAAASPAGPQVVTVSFPPLGRQADYAVDAHRSVPAVGALVVVEGFRGVALGRLVVGPHPRRTGAKGGRVRKYVRPARESDLRQQKEFEEREDRVLRQAIAWAREQRRPWKIVRVVGDGLAQKFTIAFAARERQECKEDAVALGRRLDCRVELRQLGLRDVARVLGGLGRCGRELCCSSFLVDYPNVNIRLAKEQNMALAGDKTTGVCGKTLCCLSYEGDFYKEQLRWLPRPGKRARTLDGLEGRVIGLDVFRLTFTLLDGDRRRHVLPAAAWEGNAERAVPEPEICVPASAAAIVQLPGSRPDSPARPRAPEPPGDAASPPPRDARSPDDPPTRERAGRSRRRRRPKKDKS